MAILTVHSLLEALRWAWSHYDQEHMLLERARDYQVRLYETLEDLSAANVQLTRINQLAQGLRQTAEDERRAKQQFVANVSHELRTPLNMIVGFCEMITESPEMYADALPPALLSDLTVVLRNSQHLSWLIDDVLDLSQIEAGQMALTKERVSIRELVESAAIATRPLFESKNLSLVTETEEALPLVFCDRTRIREVLLNLLSNAGRFTERGGVRVRAWQREVDVVVSVADTGPGIADEDRSRLFQPFQQLDGSIRRRYGGTGLGLSISKSFVELHNGEMWIDSQEGKGTTFYFSLPIDPPAPLSDSALRWFNPYDAYEERARPFRLQPTAVRPRLVVVEHGDAMRRLLTRHMDDTEIVPVDSIAEAEEALSQAPAQAVLINAAEVGDILAQIGGNMSLPAGIPAMVCSLPGIEQASNALGVSGYLVKPISRESLLSALAGLGRKVETVLLVDDEPDALQLFWRMLSSAGRGYRVLRAYDGRQALEIMQSQRPDAILLDLVMPEMDGFRFLSLKNQQLDWADIPTILISAQDPLGQPIVSKSLAVTCAGGLSVRRLLDCIKALNAILSRPLDGSAYQAALPG
jgi:signal transduction histidine kinase/CheY-like chemotaxis protein